MTRSVCNPFAAASNYAHGYPEKVEAKVEIMTCTWTIPHVSSTRAIAKMLPGAGETNFPYPLPWQPTMAALSLSDVAIQQLSLQTSLNTRLLPIPSRWRDLIQP